MPLYTFRGVKLPRINPSVNLGYGNSIDRYIAGLSGFPSDISPGNDLRAQTSIYNLNGIYNDEVLDVVNQIVGWDDFTDRSTTIATTGDPDFFGRLDDYRNPYSGRDTFGVRLTGTQTGTISAPRQYRIPCTAGETYRFSFWAKGKVVNFVLNVIFQGTSARSVNSFSSNLSEERWQKFYIDFVAPPSAFLYDFSWVFSGESDCVIDLPESGFFGRDPFVNECIDPSFEYGKDGYWIAVSGAISDTDQPVSSGSKAIRFEDTTGNNPYEFKSPDGVNGIEIEYFKRYFIGFKLKTFRVSGIHRFARLTTILKFYNGSGNYMSSDDQTLIEIPDDTRALSYLEFGRTVTPPDGAKYVQVIFKSLAGHENEIYKFVIDDVVVNPIIENGIIDSKRQRDMINALHGKSGVLTRIENDEITWVNAHMKLNDYSSDNQRIFSKTDDVNLNFQTEGKNWRNINSTVISGSFSDLKFYAINNGLEVLGGARLTLNLSSADDMGGTASLSFKMGGNSWTISNIPAAQSPQIVIDSYNETVTQIIGGVATNKWGNFAFNADHQSKRLITIPAGIIEIEFEITHIDTTSTFTLEFFKEYP